MLFYEHEKQNQAFWTRMEILSEKPKLQLSIFPEPLWSSYDLVQYIVHISPLTHVGQKHVTHLGLLELDDLLMVI